MLVTTNTTVEKIASYVSQMSQKDQKAVLAAFERRALMEKAVKLNKSIDKKIKITSAEIVAEIRNIRSENGNKRSRS